MPHYIVARFDEIPPGSHLLTTVAGRSIGIFNVAGELFALRNRCPHQGAELCKGRVKGAIEVAAPGEMVYSDDVHVLRCPLHGWEFNLRTGESWFDPSGTRVRSYAVHVAAGTDVARDAESGGGEVAQRAAEIYPIHVEADYVLVDVG